MKILKLSDIQDKLLELSSLYGEKYPAFYVAELAYLNKRAEILLGVTGLATQQLRDASVERMLSQLPEYEVYNKLKPEVEVITRQTWIYTELSKLVRASQFESV